MPGLAAKIVKVWFCHPPVCLSNLLIPDGTPVLLFSISTSSIPYTNYLLKHMKTRKRTPVKLLETYGKLTLIAEAPDRHFTIQGKKYAVRRVTLKCVCGKIYEADYNNWTSRYLKSCGCRKHEFINLKLAEVIHG